jgi:hypothetical protein
MDSAQHVQTLRKALEAGKVQRADIAFVTSLIQKSDNGTLTYNMRSWIERMAVKVVDPAPAIGKLPSMTGVVELLAKAKASSLKFPKLWLQFKDKTPIRIAIAGEKSRTPGYLTITDGGGFGNNQYFGRISPAGDFEVGRDGPGRTEELVKLLSALAANPAKVAAEFGHITGHCAFCGLTLKTDNSVTVGYGPDCAETYGMPWGAAATKKAKRARA